MKTISIINQKGGVGKTTTTVNLAASLAAMGYRTLIVDGDPQGNSTSGLGVETPDVTLYEVLIEPERIHGGIAQTRIENLSCLGAGRELAGAEVKLVNEFAREQRLLQALELVQDDFDFCLIDCPPSLGLLSINALTASEHALIPLQCEYYALEGLSHLLNTIKLVQQHLNPDLNIIGILFTMFDRRNRICHQVAQDVTDHFKWAVFETYIPRNVRLSEAPSYGQTIFEYDDQSRGAAGYKSLAREMVHRLYHPDPESTLS